MGDYFQHWLNVGEATEAKAKAAGNELPKIFKVNWFRKDENGKFVWPGFGQNMRVLDWIIGRCEGQAEAIETAIGYVPKYDDLHWQGSDFSKEEFQFVTDLSKDDWLKELKNHDALFTKLGDHVPTALHTARVKKGEKIAQNM